MKIKNDIPIIFIAINIIAVFLLIFFLNLIESVEGVVVFWLLTGAFLLYILAVYLISIIMDKSPVQIKAIGAGVSQFVKYLWPAWFGWQFHAMYVEMDNRILSVKIISTAIIITCALTVVFSYNNNVNKIKDKTKS